MGSVTRRPFRAAIAVVCLTLVTACETTSLAPADPPVVEQVGQSTVRAGNGQIWAVVDYGSARQSEGGEWMILDAAVTAADGRTARLTRDGVFLRTPAGIRLPLLTQAEFSQAYTELRAPLRRSDVASNPLWAYFPSNRRHCRFEFYKPPGGGVAYDEVEVNHRRACSEQLVFSVPGGVQPGRWVVGIDTEEGGLRIPFDL